MRIVVVGSGSFISRHFLLNAAGENLDVVALRHDAELSTALTGAHTVINFAIHPDFFTQPYCEDIDWDLRAARASLKADARFVMCSTRRVYPSAVAFGATENADATGDHTLYGRNKAMAEKAVRQLAPDQSMVLRLSNIFGFEFTVGRRRDTFLGHLLSTLHDEGVICFDMSDATRRDFLPVELCAEGILRAVRAKFTGVLNLGCGYPVNCGKIAHAIIDGFGCGKLIVKSEIVRDEFFLNMGKWSSMFPLPANELEILEYCVDLGRRLRNA